ncbi:DNA methyltransferase [Chondromyces apiculatus]|uniref:DNA methyltransferase n=1 Tax=Chondromyces apiculatus TaxID=51 RepID=UPI0005C4C7D3
MRTKTKTKRTGATEVDRLPVIVHAPRTDAIYNCHAYLTKVPVDAIKPFIEAFTKPDDVIVDMFAGSGMTGLAAASVGRIAKLSDISVLGQHIGRGYMSQVSPAAVRRSASAAISNAKKALGDLYLTRRVSDGFEVDVIRTIWSFVYICPSCSEQLVYFEHLDGNGKPVDTCPTCNGTFQRRSWSRASDVPVRVVVDGEDGKQVEQAVQPADLQKIARAWKDSRQEKVPSMRISADREMFGRSGLGRAGIMETKQFFSPRNALALHELWSAIGSENDEVIRNKLRFAFTACLARASRRYQWGPKRPLNAQNQTYYVAPVYFEWNVFDLFKRKVEAVLRSDALLFSRAPLFIRDFSGRATYELASAHNLSHLTDASVDYVFTDPPFGSNIFYADMNLFHEAWLGRATDDTSEAVMHTTGPKKKDSAERYERILRGAFIEAFRILKSGRFMSVVFGNSSGSIWALVQRALRDAGFSDPLHIAILDKGQRSVKGLNSGSEGVVTVDLIMTVQKPERKQRHHAEPLPQVVRLADVLANAAMSLNPEHARNPSYVYVAAVKEVIRQGHALDSFHYSDVLVGLRELGIALDPKKGLLAKPLTADALVKFER